MKFTKDELALIKICFDMNSGDNTVRYEIMPDWLKQDHDFSKSKTEKLFKQLDKKLKEEKENEFKRS
mgnify:CR=1 FL=1